MNKPFLDETLSFAQKVGDVKYAAHYKFGSKLNTGMELVARKLKEFGYNHPQINVYSYSNDDVLYSVAVDGVAFSVPVKMADKVKMPGLMVCNRNLK